MGPGDGSFLLQYQEPGGEKVPQMCGKGMIDKILRKGSSSSTSSRQQVGPLSVDTGDGSSSRYCLNPAMKKYPPKRRTYSEMPEMMMQETDSSSCASDNRQDEWTDDVPNYEPFQRGIAQFDPNQLELSSDGDRIEVEHTPSSQPQVVQDFSHTMAPQSGSWTLTLPSVAEESEEEDSDDDEKNDAFGKAMRGDANDLIQASKRQEAITPRKRKVLKAMRELVLKQQSALKELSDQNYQYKGMLADQKIAVLRLNQEKEKQQNRIDELEKGSKAAESEAAWLREELKRLKGELSCLQPTPQVRNSRARRSSDAFQHFESVSSQDSSSKNRYGSVLDRSTSGSTSGSSSDDSSTLRESRSDVIYTMSHYPREDRENISQRDSAPGKQSVSTGQVDPSLSVSSRQPLAGRNNPTPEEVALFRSRLEAIQQRRKSRKTVDKAPQRERVSTIRWGV